MLSSRRDKRGARRAAGSLMGALMLMMALPTGAGPAPQSGMAEDRYDVADARLNAAYKMLAQSLDDAGRKALRDEERQWIAGRDATCKVPSGTVVKNDCTVTQTSFRADELIKRAKGGGTAPSTESGIVGDWGYRSDCDFGHDVDFKVARTTPDVEGTWADGTRNGGSQGSFKGTWRNGRLALRFCAEDGQAGDYPACPTYSDEVAYVMPQGRQLAWHRTVNGGDDPYVVLERAPKGGKVALDTRCK